jgi:hypothetical protein
LENLYKLQITIDSNYSMDLNDTNFTNMNIDSNSNSNSNYDFIKKEINKITLVIIILCLFFLNFSYIFFLIIFKL